MMGSQKVRPWTFCLAGNDHSAGARNGTAVSRRAVVRGTDAGHQTHGFRSPYKPAACMRRLLVCAGILTAADDFLRSRKP